VPDAIAAGKAPSKSVENTVTAADGALPEKMALNEKIIAAIKFVFMPAPDCFR
jgi:hypothetical protein